MKAKRASIRDAVEWIAMNDSPADNDAMDVDAVAGLTTVCLVADIFGLAREEIARRVIAVRRKEEAREAS